MLNLFLKKTYFYIATTRIFHQTGIYQRWSPAGDHGAYPSDLQYKGGDGWTQKSRHDIRV